MRNLALMWVLAGCLLGCGGRDKNAQDKAALAVDTVAITPDTYTTFTDDTYTTFTDTRDGKVYKIVEIGNQTWFAENLNYAVEGSKCYGEGGNFLIYDEDNESIITTLLNNGEPVTISKAEVQANCAKYGRLYNWETALTVCPAGTHLPTDDEWTTLVDYVGGEDTAGKKLKSTSGWINYQEVSGNGTDEYGFLALPGGSGYSSDNFALAGSHCIWWTATEKNASNSWIRIIHSLYDVCKYNYIKTDLCSVRCVVDDEKEAQK